MNRLLLLFSVGVISLYSYGQEEEGRSLYFYIETAKENSPLITDYRNQTEIEQAELERLKAMYTHFHLELNGDYLFVPIISKDDGRTSFQWNARSATDYYGYDLGESSGFLHTGVTWTQPLLGKNAYKVAREQEKINTDIVNNRIRMEAHQLERSVTIGPGAQMQQPLAVAVIGGFTVGLPLLLLVLPSMILLIYKKRERTDNK